MPSSDPAAPLAITDARLPGGEITCLRIADGLVVSVGDPPSEGDEVLDARGALVLPAMAEAHAHLDKAFLSEVVPNPTGDLMGAIIAMEEHRHLITVADTEERAERAARLLAANGATAIRTHADTTTNNGMMSVQALLSVRDRLRSLVHIEVFALSGWPVVGEGAAPERDLLLEAIGMGVDGIGGCPHLEDDSNAAIDVFLELAGEAGLPVDLHTDEHLDGARCTLDHLSKRVIATGFSHGVAASHCVSLGLLPDTDQARLAAALAEADISVVALPASNLYLQGRDRQEGMPRALTAVRALRLAGVNLAAGWDNLQDPFNPVGRGDCLETAGLMVMAGHLLPDDAYDTVAAATRRMMGLPAAGPVVGAAADLVVVRADSVRETIALAPTPRTVIKGGRIQ